MFLPSAVSGGTGKLTGGTGKLTWIITPEVPNGWKPEVRMVKPKGIDPFPGVHCQVPC